MKTYRIFDTHTMSQDKDVMVFGPRWLARCIAWAKGTRWDYEAEDAYQRHYERAQH